MRRMAEAYLATPAITTELGEIRLAPHQVEAASRLLALLGESGGAVLADATGLGKTFVAIAVARVVGPALVVAPASLRGMWRGR
jgi:superfamily II DNA or RNA helicase